MNNKHSHYTPMQVTRRDVSVVRNTLYRLTAAQNIGCAIVLAIAVLFWWWLVHRILAFGKGLDYSGLQALGPQTLTLINQYNPFFWWAIVVLVTALLVYVLYGLLQSVQKQGRSRLLKQTTVTQLANQLSEGGLAVLDWAWENRRHPINIGVLQTTLREMRSGRASKIELALAHENALKRDPQTTDSNNYHIDY